MSRGGKVGCCCGWLLGLGLVLLTLTAGCGKGSPTVAVRGKVTLDGEPLATGTISFVPSDGATASAGGPIKDGTYNVAMPPGKKRVQISATKVVGKRQVYQGDPKSPIVDEVRELIPPQYNASSALTVEVDKTRCEHDFKLKSTR
jgi:hypothetical protein